jgi:carbonic anhydrase
VIALLFQKAPEIIFDQGLGALFVICLAGNIVADAALGSLEYAVDHLGVKYIMVLGHERCGAVEATVKGGETSGHMWSFVKAIQPAVEKVKNMPGDLLDNAVRANVAMVVQQLKSSGPILEELVKKGRLDHRRCPLEGVGGTSFNSSIAAGEGGNCDRN